jgi:2-succinyl-6-hydroxy-2,4-cyclohexadiene-1-carboxylate synthase
MINWHTRQFGNPALPNIICFHGMFGDSLDWSILHSFLEDKICLIAVDFPAHGKTKLPENLTTDELLESLTEVIKRQSASAVMGYSMGGRLLLQVMDKLESAHSTIQRYYILSADPGLSQDSNNPLRLKNDQMLLNSWIEGKKTADVFFRQWYRAPLFAGKFFENIWTNNLLATRLKLNPILLFHWLSISSAAVLPSPWDIFKRWQHKISFMVGSQDHKYLAYATELKTAAPSTNIVEMPEHYHGLLWECPDLLAKMILKSHS